MASPRPRPGILEIEPYVGGKAAIAGAAKTIKLSANETAIGPSPKAIEAARATLDEMHRYPDGDCLQLREAIGARFDLDPSRIVCGAGSDELIQFLMRAFAGPGDEVLYSAHGFLMYKLTALTVGATPVAAPETGLKIDVDALLKRVTSRTRMVFIANPNNPTGSYLDRDALVRLQDGLPDEVVLVVDAAYAEYVAAKDYEDGLGLVETSDNVVMTRTFSKLFGLAALRLGWLYAKAPIIDVLNRVRGPFNVTAAAQAAGIAALEDRDHQERSKTYNDQWLPRLTQSIAGTGLTVYPSVANFLLVGFPSKGKHTAMAAGALLEDRGIVVRPMAAYHLPDSLRITIGQETENQALIAALREFMT